ncbi:ankyrin repeat domain-containing protein [Roseinatronobacter sp. NSM]|uniref:ankyrin repeat domain-containing protein n=1 Tax=Roseinatronobacter sp. NSM TaxID=3457785 RepID=UPI0040355DFD
MSGQAASRPLVVFAYAFAHRKTQDFLFEMVAAGYHNLTVIGAPKVKLAHTDTTVYFRSGLRRAPPLKTEALCRALDLTYIECAHDDLRTITKVAQHSGARMAVISGARILKRDVIAAFPDGVLNLHPGKLPETAGLDSFYYSIMRNVVLGFTAHFIDHRIDAGHQLFFEETPIGPGDTPEIILENNYQTQILGLRRFLKLLAQDKLHTIPIDRPSKNEPMCPEAKRASLLRLPEWVARRYLDQQARRLIAAIEGNDPDMVQAVLDHHAELVAHRTPEGWTPLIVACHHQRKAIARLLLERGADPNLGGGRNGTTPLMYAKTALVGQSPPDTGLLELLLSHGAGIDRTDALGRDIFFYLEQAGADTLVAWLKSRKAP